MNKMFALQVDNVKQDCATRVAAAILHKLSHTMGLPLATFVFEADPRIIPLVQHLVNSIDHGATYHASFRTLETWVNHILTRRWP